MRWSISWALFALLAIAISPLRRVDACSCQRTHPQKQFCGSDFVILVRVKKIIPISGYEVAYKVKINKKFKMCEKSDNALKAERLYTASSGAICGAELQLGTTYVVGGKVESGIPGISLCGLAMRWSEVSPRQRKGFRRLYHHGCVCEIQNTGWWDKGEVLKKFAGKRCLWESTPGPQDCQEKHGVCMKGASGCNWMPSVPYKNCIKEYQRNRALQRTREP